MIFLRNGSAHRNTVERLQTKRQSEELRRKFLNTPRRVIIGALSAKRKSADQVRYGPEPERVRPMTTPMEVSLSPSLASKPKT